MTEVARRERIGFICGAAMALGASLSFASARFGIYAGLAPADMVFARFVVAGAIMLPFLLRWGVRGLAGIGWRRGLILVLLGGPFFAMLQTGGYAFAPLAHGAVIAPSTVTVLSTIMAALFLRERLSAAHLLGAIVVIGGIVLIGWEGVTGKAEAGAWIGDLLFFFSSVLWAVFTLLLRHWRVNALHATAVVAVLSMLIMTPVYLIVFGLDHLKALPLGALALQGLVQGGLQGVATMIAYGFAVAYLGVSRAVLFPALVPGLSVLVGIPIVGEIPSPLQITGLLLGTLGLLITTGVVQRWLRGRKPRA